MAEDATPKPSFVSEATLQEMLLFLDAVRESGEVNMFGAAVPLRKMYSELSKSEAREVLTYWMKTFSARHS